MLKRASILFASIFLICFGRSAYCAEQACPDYLNQTLRKLHSKEQLNLCFLSARCADFDRKHGQPLRLHQTI